MGLAELTRQKRIVICVGSGGVGKTTTAAAIAVRGASEGRKALVLTVDPAKRLANSLGLEELGNEERLVPPEKFARAGLPLRGSLHAMMLDTKRTFDDLVTRYAPREETRQKILDNRIYKHLSGALAGSQEYMAMEKVYEVYRERDYDLVVLDTPPTAHALDFLDAPKRMINVLDTPVLRSLPKLSGKLSRKAFFGSGIVLHQIARLTGMQFFEALAEFLSNFTEMFDGFKERARMVYEGLQGQEVAFLLVTSPMGATINEALFFYEKLLEARMPFGGFVLNRVHPSRGPCNAVIVHELLQKLYERRDVQAIPRDSLATLLQKLCKNLEDAELLASNDRTEIARLKDRTGGNHVYVEVPRFNHDIYDLAGLSEVGQYLFDSGEARPKAQATER
jgi:anion-transporting  ArsA/GET3 family ATPase